MCAASNMTLDVDPLYDYPDYFNGHCYSLYDSKNVNEAEKICTQTCGHIVSIHSEAVRTIIPL